MGGEVYPFATICPRSFFLNTRNQYFDSTINNSDGDLLISKEKFWEFMKNKYKFSINTNDITHCMKGNNIYSENSETDNSLIFYTMKVDHFNHSFYKFSSYTLRHIYAIEVAILSFMRWVDEHPEYALIVSSDHGGQSFYEEDNICNHGCMTPGNEAIFMVYTKELSEIETGKPRTHEEFGGIEDIAPSVAQILENVNLPLEARGFPLFFNNNPVLNLASMRAKDLQIRKYIKTFTKLYGGKNSKLHSILKKVTHSRFSKIIEKIKNEEDIAKLIPDVDTFLKAYKAFLSEKQVEIEALAKNMSRTLYAKLILLLLFAFLFYRLYNSFKYISEKNSKSILHKKHFMLGLYLVLICLFVDFFVSLLKPKVLADTFIYSHLAFHFIVLIAVYIVGSQSFLSKEEQILINNMTDATKTERHFTYGLIATVLIVNISYYFEYFQVLKFLFKTFDAGKSLDYFNYPVLIVYLLYEFRQFKIYYFDSWYCLRLDVILIIFHLALIPMMIYFDTHIPKHFVNQTEFLQYLSRSIWAMMLVNVLISLNRYYKKTPLVISNQIDKKNSNIGIRIPEKTKEMAVGLLKLPLIIFIYFESDEAERLYMYTLILPLFYYFSYYYRKLNKSNNLINLLCGVCLIMLPDIIYTLNLGSFSFDVFLKVCSKSIGDYPDQTPIFTGFLMGTHKLRLFILCAGFMLENIKFTPSSIKMKSYNLILLLEMQIIAIVISYFYYLYQDYEELYLNIFIWAGTKCIILLLVYIAMIVNFFLNTSKKVKQAKTAEIAEDTNKLI